MVITDQDRQYMNAIPADSRSRIIRRMMHGAPTEECQFEGKDDYARALLRFVQVDGHRIRAAQQHGVVTLAFVVVAPDRAPRKHREERGHFAPHHP